MFLLFFSKLPLENQSYMTHMTFELFQTCRRTMMQAYNECSLGIQSAHGRCMDVMDALGNVYHHARTVLDRINPENWNDQDAADKRNKRQTNRGNNLFRDR